VEGTTSEDRHTLKRLGVLLRIAVLLHRGRTSDPVPDLDLVVRGDALELRFPPGWLAAHMLTQADLEEEVHHLEAGGFHLTVT
jgi:exopolyphosphatase/guanosine-5'-triphosphate,3'-diphosphate pyrophosphatase